MTSNIILVMVHEIFHCYKYSKSGEICKKNCLNSKCDNYFIRNVNCQHSDFTKFSSNRRFIIKATYQKCASAEQISNPKSCQFTLSLNFTSLQLISRNFTSFFFTNFIFRCEFLKLILKTRLSFC